MGRVTTNRTLAEAILKTLKQLEADPTVDSQDPAFVYLKCTLLARLMSLELDTAEVRSTIHLVESQESKSDAPAPAEQDTAIA